MKKIALAGFCALAAFAASAQESLVKDVERQLKSNIENYPKAIETLKPAFTDESTKATAYPYFVAGKGGVEYYDHNEAFRRLGKEVDDKATSYAMLDGINYLIEAVKFDTVVDAKGKVKTKYSKDAVKLINSHFNDISNAGVALWGQKDYNGAYEAWDLYTSLPYNTVLGANAPAAPADSTMSDMLYNKALAAWQCDRLQDALNAFDAAMAKGYDKKSIYDYAISVAVQMRDTTGIAARYAEIAYPIYGKEDSRYLSYIVNEKISKGQFDQALTMLDKYIEAEPENSQLYYIRGIVYDSQENADKAEENYKKAIELNPENAQALLQYGRMLSNKAYRIDDEANTLSNEEYNNTRLNVVNPLFKESAVYFEKAYQIDPENCHNALSQLKNIYYNLQDEQNLKRIEDLILLGD